MNFTWLSEYQIALEPIILDVVYLAETELKLRSTEWDELDMIKRYSRGEGQPRDQLSQKRKMSSLGWAKLDWSEGQFQGIAFFHEVCGCFGRSWKNQKEKSAQWKAIIQDNTKVYSEVENELNQECTSRLSRENSSENLSPRYRAVIKAKQFLPFWAVCKIETSTEI